MTPEQKKEIEEDMIFFVKRVCRAEKNQCPEEVTVLPDMIKILFTWRS